MRLRRVYETADEEGRSVEEIALERFGSLAAFEEAREERRVLDERESTRGRRSDIKGKNRSEASGTPSGAGPAVRYMFNDPQASGASSRSTSFRRPGADSSSPSTPSPAGGPAPRGRPGTVRLPSHLGTPIPSAMTPPVPSKLVQTYNAKRALSPSSLNKLQAKVLRAKLVGAPNAEALEREYEEELNRANGGYEEGGRSSGVRTKVEVLPSMDGRGRLYDVGSGKDDGRPVLPGNRKKQDKVRPLQYYRYLFSHSDLTG
jgi:hypothetical protein